MKLHYISNTVAFLWFIFCWGGYTYISEFTRFRDRTVWHSLDGYRERWVCALLNRDNRVPDVAIVRCLVQSHSFFASTTIFIVAGLVTVVGAHDRVISLIRDLPFSEKTSADLALLKLTLLIGIFIYAFFKNTWSIRQLNYCAILLGGVPWREKYDAYDISHALRVAEVSSLAAKNFTQMLRAYYFGLAVLAWFLSPVAFMVATTVVVIVLYYRDRHSSLLKILGHPRDERFIFSLPGLEPIAREEFKSRRKASSSAMSPASQPAHSKGYADGDV